MRYQGLAFRAHNPFWSFSPLTGDGAKLHGGRFNPVGTAALYLSLTTTTALAEYNQGFPHRPQPSTLCAYDIDCEDIIDLRFPASRNNTGISLDSLNCPWELLVKQGKTPPSWEIVNQLMSNNVAGIIVPSYARNAPKDGANIVLWKWNNTTPHQVMLIDDFDRLPRNQLSWAND